MEKPGRRYSRRTAQGQHLVTTVHTWLYRLSRGRIGTRIVGAPVLLLTTVGRKTGSFRTVPLCYLRDDDQLVLVASNGGTASDPLWWRNLKSNPHALIETPDRRMEVRAAQADGAEHARLWPEVVELYVGYARYQELTSRQIPLVLLHPLAPQN